MLYAVLCSKVKYERSPEGIEYIDCRIFSFNIVASVAYLLKIR